MGITIPEEETELCRELMRPAWIAVGLQNDLYSWPKEKEVADRNGHTHVVNAIWVLMREHNLSVEDAEMLCRKMIKDWVTKYMQIVRKNKDNQRISMDLRKYIEAMQYSISGNVAWSLACPRYNPAASFNKAQLEWMQNGVPQMGEGKVRDESVSRPREKATLDSDSSASSSKSKESCLGLTQTQTSHPSSSSSPVSSLSSLENRAESWGIYDIISEDNLPALGTEASKIHSVGFVEIFNDWII